MNRQQGSVVCYWGNIEEHRLSHRHKASKVNCAPQFTQGHLKKKINRIDPYGTSEKIRKKEKGGEVAQDKLGNLGGDTCNEWQVNIE